MGGALGAVLRFMVSNGVYHWLGRSFPFGTLAVNILGSFLIGLMTEALIVQRVAISTEYRAAILVGVFGSFTTFSTFSLETVFLLEQGNFAKAGYNILLSVGTCLLAVWIGLLLGRTLFNYSGGIIHWNGGIVPFALMIVNAVGAFLLGIISALLLAKVNMSLEHRAAIIVVMTGLYLTFSTLYVLLYLIESGHSFDTHLTVILTVFVSNLLISGTMLWLGMLTGKQL